MLLYGQMLTGRKYVPKANGVVELEKQWAKQVLPFAFQTVVKVPQHTHTHTHIEITYGSKQRKMVNLDFNPTIKYFRYEQNCRKGGCCKAWTIKPLRNV